MELKKNKPADHLRHRTLFLCIGLCVSILIIFMAFETKAEYIADVLPKPPDQFTEWTPLIPRTTFPERHAPPKPKLKPKTIVITTEPILESLKESIKETQLDQPLADDPTDWVYEEESYDGPKEGFEVIEQKASFPGGNAAWSQFLRKNIKYPRLAKRSGIEGKVFLSFYVDAQGLVSDIKILKGIGGGCDEEAIRVLKSSSQWNPGLQRGRAVKSPMSLFIKFVLK